MVYSHMYYDEKFELENKCISCKKTIKDCGGLGIAPLKWKARKRYPIGRNCYYSFPRIFFGNGPKENDYSWGSIFKVYLGKISVDFYRNDTPAFSQYSPIRKRPSCGRT